MSPEETREVERARALATWVDDRDEGGRLRPLPDEIDLDAGQAIVGLRPDLAPGPYVDEHDIVALLDEAARLEAFLDGDAGDSLDPDLRAAAVALRPSRAPAPKVTIDDILAKVTAGPFAFHGTETEVRPDSVAFHGTETELRPDSVAFHGTETELQPANAPMGHAGANNPKGFAEPKALEGARKVRRRGWLPWLMAGGGTAGFATLVMAAVALFVLVPMADTTSPEAQLAPRPSTPSPTASTPIAELEAAPKDASGAGLEGLVAGGGGEAPSAAPAEPRRDAPYKTVAKESPGDVTVATEGWGFGGAGATGSPAPIVAASPPPPPAPPTDTVATASGGGSYKAPVDQGYATVETVASKAKAEREEKRVRGAPAAAAPAANLSYDDRAAEQTGLTEDDAVASARDEAAQRRVSAPSLPAADADRIRALEAEAEQLAAAGKFLDAAIKLAPAIGTNAGIAHWYGAKVARWQLTGGSAVAAEATCKKALTFGKSSAQAPALYLVYGDVLDRLGRDTDASRAWESAAH